MAAKRAHWFENYIADYLLKKASNSGRSNGLVRGSSLGVKCSRRIGYMVLGYGEEPTSAHNQYVLGFGNAFHDLIQTWMSDSGMVNAKPYLAQDNSLQWSGDAEGTLLDPDDGVIGHYDGLTIPLSETYTADNNGKRYLLEFKTITNKSRVHVVKYEVINGQGFTVKYTLSPGLALYDILPRLEGSPPKAIGSKGNEIYLSYVKEYNVVNGTVLDVLHKKGQFSELIKPKEEHVYQSTYYAYKLDADAIIVVYLAKDFDETQYESVDIKNVPIKAFEFNVEPSVVSTIKSKLNKLWNSLETAGLPPREFSPLDMFSECNFCPYRYTCYPEHKNKTRFEQQAVLKLPVPTGQPFEKHDADSWGREAAKGGLIKDRF